MSIQSNAMNKRIAFKTIADGTTFQIPNSFWFSVTPESGATVTLTNLTPIPQGSDTSITFATPFSASSEGNGLAPLDITATGGDVYCVWLQG